MLMILLGVSAQAQFKIGAEYRIRSEYKDGLRQLSDESTTPAFVTSQRTRLNVDYNYDKLQIYLAIQDVRVWGETPHKTDVPSLDVHEAYARYSMNNKWAVKLGRQMLSYDNKYLLGVKNWNNVSVSHDIALLQYASDDNAFDVGFAYNNAKDVVFEEGYDLNYYRYLAMLWYHHKFGDRLSASLLNYYEGRQKDESITTIYTRGTIGPFINYKSDKWGFTFAPYYQFGKSQDGETVNAYFIHFEPTLYAVPKFRFGIGVDYFSGDDATDDNGEANTFSNPYGDGHAFYGLMDYFTNIEKNTNNGGLHDKFIKVTYSPNKKMSIQLGLHDFNLTNNILDPTTGEAADKALGKEMDLYWKYNFYTSSTLLIGYSTMSATQTMEILKGGDSDRQQNWVYLTIQFKPTLFKSDIK